MLIKGSAIKCRSLSLEDQLPRNRWGNYFNPGRTNRILYNFYLSFRVNGCPGYMQNEPGLNEKDLVLRVLDPLAESKTLIEDWGRGTTDSINIMP
jgi:hypothetical protein